MENKELFELFERLASEEGSDVQNGDRLLAVAVRLSGVQIASGLAMIAQSLDEIRGEMLNQRMTSR